MGLQQRKSRWIGHADDSQGILGKLGSGLADSCRTDINPKADTKFLPKLNVDSGGATRPLGRAKTTGKLLTQSSTAGVLCSYKGQDSRKAFLLKGVTAPRPGT